MLKRITILSMLLLAGCGEVTQTMGVTPDENITIPKDENVSLQPSNGVNVSVSDDGNYYVISGDGNVVVIGDNNVYGDGNGDTTTTTTTVTQQLWYYYDGSGCCYDCGNCDSNVTEPVGTMSIDECVDTDIYSGGPIWCYEN